MVIKEALNVLTQSLDLGAKNGAYGITDSAIINTAYQTLVKYVNDIEESRTLTKEEPDSDPEVKEETK